MAIEERDLLGKEDVDIIRSLAEGYLYEGTQRLGSDAHKAEFFNYQGHLIDLVYTDPVGGNDKIRHLVRQALAVADKIERRLRT